jgi:hypothetical protein
MYSFSVTYIYLLYVRHLKPVKVSQYQMKLEKKNKYRKLVKQKYYLKQI